MKSALTPDFYYDTMHLDIRGHRLYADRIAETLKPLIASVVR